jgi:hypothetical protein
MELLIKMLPTLLYGPMVLSGPMQLVMICLGIGLAKSRQPNSAPALVVTSAVTSAVTLVTFLVVTVSRYDFCQF